MTVNDANRYVTDRVKKWAVEHGLAQSPTLQTAETGEIILARCRPAREDAASSDAGEPAVPRRTRRTDGLTRYRRDLVDTLSRQDLHFDRQFVRLSLLVRQEQGYAPAPDARTYNDLRVLLAEIDDRAVVLLGAPGSGKTTLLRRLQLDDANDRLADGKPGVTFFATLGRYPIDAVDPGAWLAAVWRTQAPGLPAFDRLQADGRLLLLLDALNEMPHRDDDHLKARVAQWREFLRDHTRAGNRAVFTCRYLDYSEVLDSKRGDDPDGVAVRQVTVQPMDDGQVRDFLARYTLQQAEAVWTALGQDRRQLDLFRTPIFLDLLVRQLGPHGEVPRGRAALFTGFTRAMLWREVSYEKHLPQSTHADRRVFHIVSSRLVCTLYPTRQARSIAAGFTECPPRRPAPPAVVTPLRASSSL